MDIKHSFLHCLYILFSNYWKHKQTRWKHEKQIGRSNENAKHHQKPVKCVAFVCQPCRFICLAALSRPFITQIHAGIKQIQAGTIFDNVSWKHCICDSLASLRLANHISIANYTPLFENIFQMSQLHMLRGRQKHPSKSRSVVILKMGYTNDSGPYFSDKTTALDGFERKIISVCQHLLHIFGLQGCFSCACWCIMLSFPQK